MPTFVDLSLIYSLGYRAIDPSEDTERFSISYDAASIVTEPSIRARILKANCSIIARHSLQSNRAIDPSEDTERAE